MLIPNGKRAQRLFGSWRVAHCSSDRRLEKQSKGQLVVPAVNIFIFTIHVLLLLKAFTSQCMCWNAGIPVPHAVLQDGESTRLADDQIGPLHEHDRHEVRGLEGELELLSLVERLEQKF